VVASKWAKVVAGGRVGQVIGRDVDCLDRSDRSLLGGGDSLLHTSHVGGEGGLVSDGGGDSTEKSRNLRSGLGESEDVVDEEENVLSLVVSEVLSDRKTSEGNSGSGTGGLVHLSENESDLGVSLEAGKGRMERGVRTRFLDEYKHCEKRT
jgi:hypothetical protein